MFNTLRLRIWYTLRLVPLIWPPFWSNTFWYNCFDIYHGRFFLVYFWVFTTGVACSPTDHLAWWGGRPLVWLLASHIVGLLLWCRWLCRRVCFETPWGERIGTFFKKDLQLGGLLLLDTHCWVIILHACTIYHSHCARLCSYMCTFIIYFPTDWPLKKTLNIWVKTRQFLFSDVNNIV